MQKDKSGKNIRKGSIVKFNNIHYGTGEGVIIDTNKNNACVYVKNASTKHLINQPIQMQFYTLERIKF